MPIRVDSIEIVSRATDSSRTGAGREAIDTACAPQADSEDLNWLELADRRSTQKSSHQEEHVS
jgi:hypothetical protein